MEALSQPNGHSKITKAPLSLSRQPAPSSSSSSSENESEGEERPSAVKTLDDVTDQDNICAALGILPIKKEPTTNGDYWVDDEKDGSKQGKEGVSEFYDLVPNPDADEVDLSVLRGAQNVTISAKERMMDMNEAEGSDELNALAEIVPNLVDPSTNKVSQSAANSNYARSQPESKEEVLGRIGNIEKNRSRHASTQPQRGSFGDFLSPQNPEPSEERFINHQQSNVAQKGDNKDGDDASHDSSVTALKDADVNSIDDNDETKDKIRGSSDEQDISGFDDDGSEKETSKVKVREKPAKSRPEGMQKYQSVTSISSATVSTHEVRMPMFLPTFKPATGCTNASDFIVRCFVARLRSGITVVKHGRSRWCKSRLRILHVHQDGRSLSWKPAVGEPTSSKRPPKLDLSTCMEVRHAWSPDPLYPMYTGTPILRNKCEAANAHKSFALIFPKRTVDITAVTADQCKVLMEGFSALCFRLQVANLAGQTKKKSSSDNKSDGERTTDSNTLTNNSGTGLSPNGSSKKKKNSR